MLLPGKLHTTAVKSEEETNQGQRNNYRYRNGWRYTVWCERCFCCME